MGDCLLSAEHMVSEMGPNEMKPLRCPPRPLHAGTWHDTCSLFQKLAPCLEALYLRTWPHWVRLINELA